MSYNTSRIFAMNSMQFCPYQFCDDNQKKKNNKKQQPYLEMSFQVIKS